MPYALPNPSTSDSAVATPVNAPSRNKFLLLTSESADDAKVFPPQRGGHLKLFRARSPSFHLNGISWQGISREFFSGNSALQCVGSVTREKLLNGAKRQ